MTPGFGLQMVRCFEDDDVHHVNGKVDALADIDIINFELALADVSQIEKRIERLKKGRSKTKDEEARNQVSCDASQALLRPALQKHQFS